MDSKQITSDWGQTTPVSINNYSGILSLKVSGNRVFTYILISLWHLNHEGECKNRCLGTGGLLIFIETTSPEAKASPCQAKLSGNTNVCHTWMTVSCSLVLSGVFRWTDEQIFSDSRDNPDMKRSSFCQRYSCIYASFVAFTPGVE